MKPIVISMPLAAISVDGQKWLKQDGAGAVALNDGAATGIGVSASKADNSATPDPKFHRDTVGCVKQGLNRLEADTGAYEVGDLLELKADGQTLTAFVAGTLYGSAAETKTLAAPGKLQVYINVA